MADLLPIKVYRPSSDKFGLVSCRSYDDYHPSELAASIEYNNYSFLNVLHLAYQKVEQFSHEKRFNLVHQKFLEFLSNKTLVSESKEVFYLYEISYENQSFTGIVGAIAMKDYQQKIIKKHENTLSYRVNVFKDFLSHAKINTEPALITYPDSANINTWVQLKKQQDPNYFFSTTDHQQHKIWTLETVSDLEWIQNNFEQIKSLYIADGHHRLASAEAYYKEHPNDEQAKSFMAFLLPESQLKIYSFYRLVKFFPFKSVNEFLTLVAEHYVIKKTSSSLIYPQDKFEFVVYLKQKYYLIKYKKLLADEDFSSKQLDCYILHETILQNFFGITDLRNDERIGYYPAQLSFLDIKKKVDDDDYKIAFMTYPTSIDEIKNIANLDEVMPPKSTYILPKFRSGLFVYPYF